MLNQQFRYSLLTVVLFVCCHPALARDPVPVSLPATADGAVKTVVNALVEGKFEVLWQALPTSYQADVKKLTDAFAKKMDADLWDQGSKVAGKVAKLFTDKTDFIIGNQIVAQQLQARAIKPEDAKQYLTAIGGLLAEVQTGTATLPDVEKIDVEKLLANIGPKFRDLNEASARIGVLPQGSNMNDLLKLEVKFISSSGDSATLEVIQANGKKKTEDYVRVEGKWIPKEMADAWQAKMSEALKGLEALQIKPEDKQQFLMLTGMANGFLDTFLNAKTQAEFDAAVNVVLPLIQLQEPKNLGGPAAIQQRPAQ